MILIIESFSNYISHYAIINEVLLDVIVIYCYTKNAVLINKYAQKYLVINLVTEMQQDIITLMNVHFFLYQFIKK